MKESELEILGRAHDLFTGSTGPVPMEAAEFGRGRPLDRAVDLGAGDAHRRYQLAVLDSRTAASSAARTDAGISSVISAAYQDHTQARRATGHVLDEARADAAVADNPMAQREAARRRIARLRAQRAHVVTARGQAQRHAAALRALNYRQARRRRHRLHGLRLPASNSRAGIAVRAALSRLGRPYVWGATGPYQFDCSGLVKWSYAQAGVHLDRTTYQQIHEGIPVPRAQAQPGDLVFPHAGHVQIAIGHNLVVEAPYPGATVRISAMGANVAIRRPVP